MAEINLESSKYMTYQIRELLPIPAEFLLKRLETLIQIMVIVEASALILIVIIFAILFWLSSGEIERTNYNQETL